MALKGPQLYSLTSVVYSGPRFFLTALNKTQWKTKDIKVSLGNLFKDLHSHQRSDLAVWDISDMLLKLLLKIQLIIWESIKRMSLPAGVWMRVVAKLTLSVHDEEEEKQSQLFPTIYNIPTMCLSLLLTHTHTVDPNPQNLRTWPRPSSGSHKWKSQPDSVWACVRSAFQFTRAVYQLATETYNIIISCVICVCVSVHACGAKLWAWWKTYLVFLCVTAAVPLKRLKTGEPETKGEGVVKGW